MGLSIFFPRLIDFFFFKYEEGLKGIIFSPLPPLPPQKKTHTKFPNVFFNWLVIVQEDTQALMKLT